jgi:DNA invertase Pin-like site-specific DNA recombinase
MLKRHEVEILLKAGHGKAEVARLTGVSLCSVKRIAQEATRQFESRLPRAVSDHRCEITGVKSWADRLNH